MAELNMKRGKVDKALSELGTSNTYAETAENFKNIAKCNEILGNITDALENYKTALEQVNHPDKGPENKKEKNTLKASIYLERGKLHMKERSKGYAAAKQDFDEAIALPEVRAETGLPAEV